MIDTHTAALLGAAFLFGCSAAGEPERAPLRLSTDESHMGAISDAAQRWQAAAGIPVEVMSKGGVPVVFLPQVFDLYREICGGLVHTVSGRIVRIEIATESSGFCSGGSLLHEIGHAIVLYHGHAGHEHVEAPGHLMSEKSNRTTMIDETSLAFICERAPCGQFAPENN